MWLEEAEYHDGGTVIEGWTWDDSSVGSALMPDDFMGEKIILAYPSRYILRVEQEAA